MERPIGLVLAVVLSTGACKRADEKIDPATRLEECERLDGRAKADDCYERRAVAAGKPGLCARIVGARAKNDCFQGVAPVVNDVALCAKIDESTQRASCRADVARTRRDPELCKTIEEGGARSVCLKDVAIAKKDAAVCDTVEDVLTRLDCLVALATDDPRVCERLPDQALRDQCFSRALTAEAASREGEPLCDRIGDIVLRDGCWSTIAARRDPVLCERVSTTEGQESCYLIAMVTSGVEPACERVARPEGVDLCLHALAQKKGDAATCMKIQSAERKEACVVALAKQRHDAAACFFITDAARKKKCTEEAAAPKSVPWPGTLEAARKGITRVGPNEYRLTHPARDLLSANQAALFTTLRMVPEREDGGMVGMRLFGIRSDSPLGALGLENGDRVVRVNGLDVTSAEKINEVSLRLRSADKVTVDIVRRGVEQRLVYTIQ